MDGLQFSDASTEAAQLAADMEKVGAALLAAVDPADPAPRALVERLVESGQDLATLSIRWFQQKGAVLRTAQIYQVARDRRILDRPTALVALQSGELIRLTLRDDVLADQLAPGDVVDLTVDHANVADVLGHMPPPALTTKRIVADARGRARAPPRDARPRRPQRGAHGGHRDPLDRRAHPGALRRPPAHRPGLRAARAGGLARAVSARSPVRGQGGAGCGGRRAPDGEARRKPMKSVRIIAMSLFLLGAVACEGDGGGGGADCPAQCERLVPLCRYDQAFDHEECQTSCETGTAGKTAASIAAAAACIDQATSCAVALACEDLLAAPAASGSPRERAEASARGLCGKLESCGMPADQRGECVAQGEVMLPYVTDVAKFVGCVDAQSCTDLFTDESVLVDCLALDWASFRCEGDTTLHYCDLDGVCVAADCAEVCDELADGVTVDTGCGGSGTTAEEHPKCRCYQR